MEKLVLGGCTPFSKISRSAFASLCPINEGPWVEEVEWRGSGYATRRGCSVGRVAYTKDAGGTAFSESADGSIINFQISNVSVGETN